MAAFYQAGDFIDLGGVPWRLTSKTAALANRRLAESRLANADDPRFVALINGRN